VYSNGTTLVFRDSCPSSPAGFIYEYYCVGINRTLANGTVVNDTLQAGTYYGNCSNGCSNGACTPRPPICTDTDGGQVAGTVGTVTVTGDLSSAAFTDRCYNSTTVLEGYCTNPLGSSIPTMFITCPSSQSCSNGACVSSTPPTTCVESDGGNNPSVFSTLNLSNSSGTRFYQDSCISSTTVREVYCDLSFLDRYRAVYVTCPTGQMCSNGGACVSSTPPIPITFTCSDTDGGQNNGTAGTVSANASRGGVVISSNISRDFCYTNVSVMEQYCTSSTSLNASRVIACSSGQFCSSGACIPITYTCLDTDRGSYANIQGNVTITPSSGAQTRAADTCVNSSYVGEYTCSSSTASSLTYNSLPCSGTTVACRNGACTSLVSYTCTDSDSGVDANTAGYVTVTSPTGTTTTSNDRCLDSNHVTEYSCPYGTASTATSYGIACSAGKTCSAGACIPITYTCRDSDGSNLGIAGNVTITPSVGAPTVSRDECTGSDGRGAYLGVNEYTCASATASTATRRQYNCPSGQTCSSGRCR